MCPLCSGSIDAPFSVSPSGANNRDYQSGLGCYNQMVSSGNFSEISGFMPGIKSLLNLGIQLRVWSWTAYFEIRFCQLLLNKFFEGQYILSWLISWERDVATLQAQFNCLLLEDDDLLWKGRQYIWLWWTDDKSGERNGGKLLDHPISNLRGMMVFFRIQL